MKLILFLLIGINLLFADFSKSGDIVTDNTTGLFWQDNSDAKELTKTWQEAIDYCEALKLGGYSDWRLPNKNELLSIVDYSLYIPSINSTFENITSGYYWSSTTNADSTSYAWDVDFGYGGAGNYGKTGSTYVRCVRGGQFEPFDNSLKTLSLESENFQDNSLAKESFTKSWKFSEDISAYSVEVVSNTYSNSLTSSDFTFSQDTLLVPLTPDTSVAENMLVVKLLDENGNTIMIDNSKTFWSKTLTNTPPTLDENQQYQIAGYEEGTLILPLLVYDADGDSVSISVKSSDGESASINSNNELVLVSTDNTKIIHKVVVTLSDGKSTTDKEINVLRFDETNIASFYSDANGMTKNFNYIAYATLKGAIWGSEDPSDSTKRVFRPSHNASMAETLKMVIISASIAKQIEMPNYESVLQVYPEWAGKYYTYAKENSAIDFSSDDLSSTYITREELARLIVKTLKLDERLAGFSLLSITFSDADSFSNSTLLEYAKIARVFGLFMTSDTANPQGEITRGELSKVISKIFMMPYAKLNIPSSVEYGESLTIGELLNKKASKVDTALGSYGEIDSSGEVIVEYAVNGVVLSDNTIEASKLNIGENKVIALLDNNGVRDFLFKNFTVTFSDTDGDGVQDSQDVWSDDARYSKDDNQNGIPDILDFIYDLEDKTASDTIDNGDSSVTVEQVIADGGYTAPATSSEYEQNTTSLTIPLKAGWNLVSGSITNVAEISTKASIIWKYTNSQWRAFSNKADIKTVIDNAQLPNIASIYNGEGFWVLADDDFDLSISDNSSTNGTSHGAGWHLLGTNNDISLSEFGCSNSEFVSAWKYKNNSWLLNTTIQNSLGFESFDTVEANEGFWLKCK
ncbi:MAG: DUF1566 domain-containing protein [Campylobacterales bacterium]|nr:DUF1566 domain-containing protein [Campylobacterales bacterium]